jgi:hypothetical protein
MLWLLLWSLLLLLLVVALLFNERTHLRCPHSQHQTSSHERPAQSHVTCVVGRIIHAARGPTVSRSSTPDLPLAAPCGGLATCWAPTSSQLGAGPARPWARCALPQQRTYPCQQAGVGLGSAASPSCRSDASRRRARERPPNPHTGGHGRPSGVAQAVRCALGLVLHWVGSH